MYGGLYTGSDQRDSLNDITVKGYFVIRQALPWENLVRQPYDGAAGRWVMNARHEQQRPKFPWTDMEDDAMKIRALLTRYAFLVGALALALILAGLVAFLPQAAGQGGMASAPAWSASQPAPAETPLPPGTQGEESGSPAGSVAPASEALSLAAAASTYMCHAATSPSSSRYIVGQFDRGG